MKLMEEETTRKHTRTHFPTNPCPREGCSEVFPEMREVYRHIRSHHGPWAVAHPELANLPPVSTSRCEFCGYHSPGRPDHVKRHMKRYKGKCAKRAE